jgi:hypothetical protein
MHVHRNTYAYISQQIFRFKNYAANEVSVNMEILHSIRQMSFTLVNYNLIWYIIK